MYAACTWQLDQAMKFGFLAYLPHIFLYIALSAWVVTFASMLRAMARNLRGRVV
jgi:type III secretory pathway component EscR